MAHLAAVWKKSFDLELSNIKGSGAAGGMGAGSRAFLKAELKSGIEYMLQLARIPEKIQTSRPGHHG
jgi:glycerate kinase